MRIAIVGAGAVGGYFGGRLQQAGEEVVFLARGKTLAALRERGLRIDSPAGDLELGDVVASDDPNRLGPCDAVILGVKAWQVPDVAATLSPLIGAGTVLLPLQNGVEASDQLSAVHGRERVLGGLCKIISMVVAPGHIRHVGVEPWIALGELDDRRSGRVAALATVLERAGVTVDVPRDIRRALWEKFLMIVSTSGVGAVTRATIGEVRSRPETRELLRRAMTETRDVGRSLGVAIPEDAVESTLAFVDTLPAEGTASMQRDVTEGRPSELESQTGAVVRLGRESGVETPVNAFIYHVLLPMEARARAVRPEDA